MIGKGRVTAIALVSVLATAAAGLLLRSSLEERALGYGSEASDAGGTVLKAGTKRPEFELPDLEGAMRSIEEWDGKVLVVNFWATWCPPCREEIPAFIGLQSRYAERGLQFVGIAVDQLDVVRVYSQAMGINYPILVGELDAIEVGRQYGNRVGALPYTVVVDRQRRITYTKQGELRREEAEKIILSLL